MSSSQLEEDILVAIRRIVRAVDLRSRALVRGHRITGPQLVTLRKVAALGPVSVSALARAISLSQPTVTGILHRLERAGLIRRERSERDRRSILSTVTADGARVLKDAPSLLQDRFLRELARLEDWERTQMLATLQRIAAMMDAEDIDAAPLLTTDSFPAANEVAQTTSDFSPHADPRSDEAEERSA
jgi:DNA-binding MarR family transcriptional regulator